MVSWELIRFFEGLYCQASLIHFSDGLVDPLFYFFGGLVEIVKVILSSIGLRDSSAEFYGFLGVAKEGKRNWGLGGISLPESEPSLLFRGGLLLTRSENSIAWF